MQPIILHHYDLSPFSEKVRRVLAYKDLPWRAVEQPLMAPKPELTPLTGGYRRIPVMQIGADVYCDTALIVRRLEALAPNPPVLPAALAGTIGLIEDWADHRLFMQVVPPIIVDLLAVLPLEFLSDRAAMSPGFTEASLRAAAPHALEQTCHSLDHLAQALAGRPYLLGDAFTVADAACFHCVWFLRNSARVYPQVERRPALAAWVERIAAFGPGKVTPMTAGQALELARAAAPADVDGPSVTDAGYGPGNTVTIVADDYGRETTTGTVGRVRADEVVVLREDGAVGSIAVHYPRAGYRVAKV